jgi:hypothetical protein
MRTIQTETFLELLSRCSDGLRAGRPRPESRLGQESALYSTSSRPALGPTQAPIQWVSGVKLPEREADHSPPSSAEVKNGASSFVVFN